MVFHSKHLLAICGWLAAMSVASPAVGVSSALNPNIKRWLTRFRNPACVGSKEVFLSLLANASCTMGISMLAYVQLVLWSVFGGANKAQPDEFPCPAEVSMKGSMRSTESANVQKGNPCVVIFTGPDGAGVRP
jgi:hypothetical protein